MSKGRNSRIELLRLLAMLLIIMGHDIMASGLPLPVGEEGLSASGHLNLVICRTLFSAGHWGAISFFLITGYFWQGERVRIKAVSHILLVTAFYLALFPLLAFMSAGQRVGLTFSYIMYIMLYPYWFVTAYLVMMLVYPPIVRLAGEKGLSGLTRLLGTALLILWGMDLGGRGFAAMPPVYIFLAPLFFLLLGRKLRGACTNLGAGAFLAFLAAVFLLMAAVIAAGGEGMYRKIGTVISPQNIALPCFLLMYFRKLPPISSRLINRAASLCLGIYLIHVNPYVNHLLWGTVFVKAEMLDNPWLLPRLLLEATSILVFCAVAEGMRQKLASLARLGRSEP